MPSIDRLGRYEIRRELGRGAMGVVYEGYDPTIKRTVAIKTIRADQLAAEQAAVVMARFRREAQAAGRLSHPNIVAVYDYGDDEGTSFIAMECVEGRDLREIFDANERVSSADAVRLMEQILAALEYSHARGVIHRDIKPGNVFVRADGSVKVADFGIAHIESSSLTQVGSVIGTPSYMSPEQIMGLPVDGRSDLFSAGVILYQFLTGERPFTGSSTTTMQKVLKEDPLPPSTLNVQLPDAVDAVVRKALAKRPEDRFQTAAEFATALRSAMGPASRSMPLAAPPAGASDATEVHVPNTRPVPQHTAAASPAPTAAPAYPVAAKSQTTAIAVALGVAFVAVVAGWWLLTQFGLGSAKTVTTAAPKQETTAVAATPAPAVEPPAAPVAAAQQRADPGTLLISAVGLVDPDNPRYTGNPALLQNDLRADARSQLVEKAVGLLVERASLAKNYEAVTSRLLEKSDAFIGTVVRESGPRTGKDGLVSMSTEALVNVKAVQKSLNQMTRDERIELIRASGDPRISFRILVRDADRPDAPAQPSLSAENLLKERIKSFGFRTWNDDGDPAKAGDFAVHGEAKLRKVTTRLDASGLVITKYAVSAWTVKCIDRATGEEIYFNTAMPKGGGTWASEEEALKAIGAKIADEFSRDFFLQHVKPASQRVTLILEGLPDATGELVAREFPGLPAVIASRARDGTGPRSYDLDLAGVGSPSELVAAGVLAPLNAKLGQACFSLGGTSGSEVRTVFDAKCSDPKVLSRLETHPPAGLYGAPQSRQNSVIKNPETLRKLSI